MGQAGRQEGAVAPPTHTHTEPSPGRWSHPQRSPRNLVLEEERNGGVWGPLSLHRLWGSHCLAFGLTPAHPAPVQAQRDRPCVLGHVVAGVFLAVPRVEAPDALEVSVCPQELFLFGVPSIHHNNSSG